jgi:hypothetical protein
MGLPFRLGPQGGQSAVVGTAERHEMAPWRPPARTVPGALVGAPGSWPLLMTTDCVPARQG